MTQPSIQPNSGYLQPVDKHPNNFSKDGYLKPMAPVKPNNHQDSGYLEPANKKINDTYGGGSSGKYLPVSQKDTYIGPRVTSGSGVADQNYINDEPSSGYMNEDQLIDDDDENDNYLLPRHGSNMSSSTVDSTNSRTPLSKFKKLENPGSRPQRSNVHYIPPPAPILNKLSQFKSINETDV